MVLNKYLISTKEKYCIMAIAQKQEDRAVLDKKNIVENQALPKIGCHCILVC